MTTLDDLIGHRTPAPVPRRRLDGARGRHHSSSVVNAGAPHPVDLTLVSAS